MNVSSNTVRLAAVQIPCDARAEVQLARAVDSVRQAADQGAQIVCLQELVTHRYFCQQEDHRFFELAESIPGPTTDRFAQLAQELGIVVVAGLFERRARGVFHNTAVILDADGRLAGKYRKMHIPDDPFFYEKFYFAPGDLGFPAFTTRFADLGVCICWDQWFPEAARLTALRGAAVLIYPTAIGWLEVDKADHGPSQLSAWQTMIRSHAIANGVFVVAPNRVGREDHIEFWGSSFIADPYGNILAQASQTDCEIIIADANLDDVETARTHWPFLRDRRIDAYGSLVQRVIDASDD